MQVSIHHTHVGYPNYHSLPSEVTCTSSTADDLRVAVLRTKSAHLARSLVLRAVGRCASEGVEHRARTRAVVARDLARVEAVLEAASSRQVVEADLEVCTRATWCDRSNNSAGDIRNAAGGGESRGVGDAGQD